jgi:hypothetical protein
MPGDDDSRSPSAAVEQHDVVPRLACFRESPNPCINQALVDELKPLRDHRFLEYGSTSRTFLFAPTARSG